MPQGLLQLGLSNSGFMTDCRSRARVPYEVTCAQRYQHLRVSERSCAVPECESENHQSSQDEQLFLSRLI